MLTGPFTALTLAISDYEGRIEAIMKAEGCARGIAIYDLFAYSRLDFWRYDEARAYLECSGIGEHVCDSERTAAVHALA